MHYCYFHFLISTFLEGDLSVVISALALFNKVNRHWAQLLLAWADVYEQINHLGIWPAS